jgi:hypothetical protein
MAYTTINKSGDYFNTKLYAGNGSTNAQTGVGFQPDLFWCKSRSNAENHTLIDAVRGVGYGIGSNTNAAQYGSTNFGSFDSDGFTWSGNLGSGNENGQTYASWNWKANGAGSSNTDGSITSTVSANTTSGFSIVKFTGTGSTATVGHGLGVTPKMILFKNTSSAVDWRVYHQSIGATHRLCLNDTSTDANDDSAFNDTSPTASVFTVGGSSSTNGSGNSMIAYCFAEKTGYSKFSNYIGNNNDNGPFVYTGFAPSFILYKQFDGGQYWNIKDNKRDTINPNSSANLSPNASDNENSIGTNRGSQAVDFLANGFKVRTSGSGNNGTGNFIYMVFGQSIVGSNNIPATAR